MVSPGDLLRIEVKLDDELDHAYYLSGKISCDGQNIMRVSFSCMAAKA
jgi:hypothetical protein